MNVNKTAKRQVVDNIKKTIQDSKSFVVVDYKGLTVDKDTTLRVAFRKEDVEYKVLKNTLVRLALNELGYKDFDEALNGPTAVAFAHNDSIAPFKVIADNIEKLNKMEVKCGMMDNKFVDSKGCALLSKVPNREILLGMLANVLNAPIRALAIGLSEVANQKAQ